MTNCHATDTSTRNGGQCASLRWAADPVTGLRSTDASHPGVIARQKSKLYLLVELVVAGVVDKRAIARVLNGLDRVETVSTEPGSLWSGAG